MFMARALFLGERGRGRTSPNPFVGAVVVADDGIVVGQGTTAPAGGPHAEVVALDAAGEQARGATLYVTLEPCSHRGRTGPCAERVVAAGIRRVVIAAADPNPRVSGRGMGLLLQNGIEVTSGVCRDLAYEQHVAFFTWVTRRRPWVVAKAAVSADGYVGPNGRPLRLTGEDADRYFQRQRAEIDAIAVGSGTVVTDDPLLTPREVFRIRPLVRVVFDWRARVPAGARLFSTLGTGPVIMVTLVSTRERRAEHFAELERMGVEVAAFDSRALGPVLAWLGERDIVSLLVEGGPALHAALAEADLIDRVQAAVTPHVLGGGVAAAQIVLDVVASGAGRSTRLGADRLTEFDVHRIG
jgi:diaminohydroxyphosphoribosylaminopyrimidine deaminase/5-amino-6-(5-phosphoribosylamino)uracil reductase